MGTGYTRNDSANNIADGNIINASDLDGEFDAVESAFNSSSGHTHDGTSAEGAPIAVLGPTQDVVITASVLRPKTTNTVDLGTSSLEFKDAFFDGTVTTDALAVTAGITSNLVTVSSDDAGSAKGPQLDILRDSSSPADSDAIGHIDFSGKDDGDNKTIYASILASIGDVTDGTEDGTLKFNTMVAGTDLTVMELSSGNVTFTSADAGALKGPVLNLYRNSASPADDDQVGRINFQGENSAGETITYAQVFSSILDVTDSTEDGRYKIGTMVAGSFDSRMDMTNTETVFNEDSKDLNFRVESNGNANMLFVDGGGDSVIIGHNAEIPIVNSSVEFSVIGTSATLGLARFGGPSTLALTASASGTVGSFSILSDDDPMGYIYWGGDDGTDIRSAGASIAAFVDGTPGSNDMPGRLVFSTTSDGSSTPTERMRISSTGAVTINEGGADADFRIESDSYSHMFFIDAGTNQALIGSGDLNDDSGTALLTIVGETHYLHVGGGSANGSNGGGFATSKQKDDSSTGWLTVGSWDNGSSRQLYYGGGAWGVQEATSHIFYAGSYDAGNGGAVEKLRIDSSNVTVNEQSQDVDFRVESNGNTHAIFVDAGNDKVGFNTSAPEAVLHAQDNGNSSKKGLQVSNYDNTAGTAQAINIDFGLNRNSGSTKAEAGRIKVGKENDWTASDSNIDSYMSFFHYKNNALNQALLINGSGDVTTNSANTSGSFSRQNAGFTARSGDSVVVARNSGTPLEVNRIGNDGTIVDLRQADSSEGTISVSGSTVSYNGFAGRHESSGISTDTERGTVVSTIDELDVYVEGTKEGQTRADHAKVKISDSVGDKRVYGVVDTFESSDKVNVTSVGIAAVKVTGACEGGDLLESNGDGTAKVQSDDIVRSKTIGKVTIGNSNTAVKLVSCVMYCG